MPAKSIKQQQYMAMCEHSLLGKKECPDMSKEKMREFAKTKHKGLPNKVKKGKK